MALKWRLQLLFKEVVQNDFKTEVFTLRNENFQCSNKGGETSQPETPYFTIVVNGEIV